MQAKNECNHDNKTENPAVKVHEYKLQTGLVVDTIVYVNRSEKHLLQGYNLPKYGFIGLSRIHVNVCLHKHNIHSLMKKILIMESTYVVYDVTLYEVIFKIDFSLMLDKNNKLV